MTNSEIAKQINDIGDMLEILANPQDSFRIVAYHNAARKIDMTSQELEDIYEKKGLNGLKEIRGIGESIAEKIEELIKTKKIFYREELITKVPRAVLEFTKIPGVGPRIALQLFKSYRVDTVAKLKAALEKDQSGKHFKEKTRQNILEGIKLLSHLTGRMPISFAEPIAREIVETLEGYPEVIKVDPVGSLRRMKETIGDIDIVAASKSPQATINKFIHETFVDHIISHGETKASIYHKRGPEIDLEILPQDQYGSLLQHFTGSKDHNIALRTWAEKHEFSISEHGVKKIQSPCLAGRQAKSKIQTNSKVQIIKCETEQKVYQTLGMQTPIPEIRENRGEIELALKHKLPKNIIDLKDIKADLHLHTRWSEGEFSVEEIALACKKMGYQYLAITDHSAGLGVTHGLKEKDIPRYISEIKKVSRKLKIPILAGLEANIMADGSIDISDKILAKLDFVIGSIHSSFRQEKNHITERLLKAINNPNIDLIGHPSGRLIERRHALNIDWDLVFQTAKKTNTIMEINAQPDRLDLNDSLIILAKEYGVRFVISTDSHYLDQLTHMRYGVAQARRGWATKADILNSFNYHTFLAKLKKK